MRKLQAYPRAVQVNYKFNKTTIAGKISGQRKDFDGNVDVFCPISNLNPTGSLVIPKSHLISRIYVHEEVIKRRKDFKE